MEEIKKIYERVIAEGKHLGEEYKPTTRFSVTRSYEDLKRELQSLECLISDQKERGDYGTNNNLLAYFMTKDFTLEDLEKEVNELKERARVGVYVLEEEKIYFALYDRGACFGCPQPGLAEYLKNEAPKISGKEIVLLDCGGACSNLEGRLTELERKKAAGTLSNEVLGSEIGAFFGGCAETLEALLMQLKYKIGAKSVTYVSGCRSKNAEESFELITI